VYTSLARGARVRVEGDAVIEKSGRRGGADDEWHAQTLIDCLPEAGTLPDTLAM